MIDNDIILSRYQLEILNILEDGNLFLSAPTSFGKTFIILEYIKRNVSSIQNVVFIVPTLALMNEMIKKIFNFFGDTYNICINSNEIIEDKNFFIFVPERSDNNFIKKISEINIDLLVYDEIYKLACNKQRINSDDRVLYMNKVYIDLIKIAKKIVLLGPYIKDMQFSRTKIKINRMYCNYMPVFNEIIPLDDGCDWMNYITNSSQLIYFKSPDSMYKVIDDLIEFLPEKDELIIKYNSEINFLKNKYSNQWYVIDLLKRGVGIHHGKTPMFLRKFYENEFNAKHINILLCTDTLMEGINTPAESLIVVDDPNSNFKLNNLIGRIGRLQPQKPIIGKAYIYNNKTKNRLTNIDEWEKLIIRAEDEESYSDEENLYLDKQYYDSEKKDEYNKKILKLKEYNVNIENIKYNNLKIDILLAMCKGKFAEYENSVDIQTCINLTTSLIKAPYYKFKKDIYFHSQEGYLPYRYYIKNLLYKHTIKSLVDDFNNSFNIDNNTNNINRFINSIFELNNYIKFKFCRIIDYIYFLNKNINNDILKQFISIVSNYNNKGISYKILEDLGIENNDASRIVKLLNINDNISISKMIKRLKNEKDIIIKNLESPFSVNNINNI